MPRCCAYSARCSAYDGNNSTVTHALCCLPARTAAGCRARVAEDGAADPPGPGECQGHRWMEWACSLAAGRERQQLADCRYPPQAAFWRTDDHGNAGLGVGAITEGIGPEASRPAPNLPTAGTGSRPSAVIHERPLFRIPPEIAGSLMLSLTAKVPRPAPRKLPPRRSKLTPSFHAVSKVECDL
jgi:hypothetical protein